MDKVDVPEEEIDVEEIMFKIKENIRRRKGSNAPIESEQKNPCGTDNQVSTQSKNNLSAIIDEIQIDLNYINTNWDIRNNSYFISSHRPIAGKALVMGRELVHKEVKRYVDPIIWKQKEFNGSVVRLLNNITKSINETSQTTEEFENNTVRKMQSEFYGKAEEQLGQAISDIQNKMAIQINDTLSAMKCEIEIEAALACVRYGMLGECEDTATSASTQDIGLNYFIFEERFRGSRTEIKQRQEAFVHCFEGCKNVLDIGCGRGEFLELLQDKGIKAQGVDIDNDMVDYCVSNGLNVEKNDAISYLEKIEDNGLDGIFLDQVVEHLDPRYLKNMLDLCYKKINYGSHILIETVNPLSFFSFANFYLDLTHKRPIHPETLRFLMEVIGFRIMEIVFLSPVTESEKLRKLDEMLTDDKYKNLKITYNYNIDKINSILYGPQDYVIIGIK